GSDARFLRGYHLYA
nr:Chain C, HLA class I histocompatibility antigen, A-2 alpha chain [Homo sapiens]4OV5_F Chain F, HLA class I histocompatibility antigen, A-2 alpha chain [Homo sapiens]4OV5_I Chain I, HLA class I histocompatibility antigen, A-2 alpha chain [Homo sapiens]4OV5_L Chain L, HLA class I histocompatibility antigen, A-2 alpha chain [Homo sapiens]4OV5_O Chain O, HLA class I histocompatibility antigen, A-2 alpha chain [Homo sapiens]4OV5_R Chain R, HLA class I histocompatibility antigen, A-2 alpha chain 